jgi:hypothetical protein
MNGILGTAIYGIIALAIAYGIVIPLQRRFSRTRPLPSKSDTVGFVFLLLVLCPLMAGYVIMGLFAALLVGTALIGIIGWLVDIDLIQIVGIQISQVTPLFLQEMPRWQVFIAIYILIFAALFLNGVRMVLNLGSKE